MPLVLNEDINELIPEWYTPKILEGEDQPIRFKIRGLTSPELEDVRDSMRFEGSGVTAKSKMTASAITKALLYGLMDWEHCVNGRGEEVVCMPIKHGNLPSDIRQEVAWKILLKSSLNSEQAKNSLSQPK